MKQIVLLFSISFACIFPESPPALAGARVDVNVIYGMYSGLALLMDVHSPETPNGYAIVHLTGTGWHDQLGFDAPLQKASEQVAIFGKPLVQAGYTVFALNHRAAPRFRYPAPIEDVQRAVRFIRHNAKRWGIDQDRIGGLGGSSGGHLVSLLGVLDGKGSPDASDAVERESAKLQCVVTRAAPIDLIRMNGNWEFGNGTIGSFMGMPLSARDAKTSPQYRAYWEASPINHVSADDPPFLLIHGDADRSVPFAESENMQKALRTAGVPVKLIRITGAGHGPTFPGAQNPPDYIQEMINWFDEHLKKRGR